MKYAVRPYYCPTCGHEEKHGTNHQGEIYCQCKACGSSPLYCREVDTHAGLPFVNAVIRCYRFDLEKTADQRAYDALVDALTERGFKKFHVFEEYRAREAMARHDGETVRLYNPQQWPDQFVSNLGRLHCWKEAAVPNRYIKTGYYLNMETANA